MVSVVFMVESVLVAELRVELGISRELARRIFPAPAPTAFGTPDGKMETVRGLVLRLDPLSKVCLSNVICRLALNESK